MTSNSDLHDDDDSDRESIANALSPRDGYFNGSDSRPRNLIVPDPSQSNSPARKEQEALEELEASRAEARNNRPSQVGVAESSTQQQAAPSIQSSPISPTRRHHDIHTSQSADESTPLISSAPPAYSPPLPGSPYHTQHNRNISQASSGNYNSMGRGPDAFFPDRDPEDLGGEQQPLIGADERRDGWGHRAVRWGEENINKIFKYLMLIFVFVMAVGFIWVLVVGIKTNRKVNEPFSNH